MKAQLIATAGALLLITQTGLMDGWNSPNMARLTEGNATLSLTLSEASWLLSYFQVGKFVSVILVPIFMELAGSRKAILYTFIPISGSWILTMFANSALCLYIAKFLSGVADGLTYGCYGIFLSEVLSSTHRGTFTAVALIGWSIGCLVATIAETYLPRKVSSGIYLLLCLPGMLLFAWIRDSPYQLVKYQQMDEAEESLSWYRGHKNNDAEMKEIIEFVESSNQVTFAAKIIQLRSPPVIKAMFLIVLVFILPQVCGILNIFFYMEIILINGKSYLVNPNQIAIYTNAVLLVFTILTINLIDKLGRRVLLIGSCAVIITALVGLGLHYYLLNVIRVDPVSIQWLPIASIITLLVAHVIGSAPVMNTLLGELFPAGISSTAAAAVSLSSALTAFISTKSYQPLIDSIGETYVFWMYAAFMALSIPVFLFLLPETKCKSLQEIQMLLNKK